MNYAIRDTFLCLNFVVLLLDIVSASCDRALGMANSEIRVDQLSASSRNGQVRLARLTTSNPWAWRPDNEENQWFQVSFDTPIYVTEISTQGFVRTQGPLKIPGYITSYRVSSLYDDPKVRPQVWTNVTNNQNQLDFNGNTNGVDTVTQTFNAPVNLRSIIIHITSCVNICYLRFELYGCQVLPTTGITSPLPLTSKTSVRMDSKVTKTTSTVKITTDVGFPDTQSTSSSYSSSNTNNMTSSRAISPTPNVTTQTEKELLSTKPVITLGVPSSTTAKNNAIVMIPGTSTTDSVKIQTDKGHSTKENSVMESPEAQSGSFTRPVAGAAIGGIFLVIIITAASCVVFRRRAKRRSKPKTQSGLQYDGPYELTVEVSILPPITPGPHTYQNTSNGVLSDDNNDRCSDINHNKNIDGETYADIPENDANKRKRSSNKNGLVDIYATSQYGGRPSSTAADDKTENSHIAQSNSQLYAKVDRKKPKPGLRSDEAGSPRTSAEGWMDNDIYATGDAEAVEGNGWRDNSIYASTDNGEERDHREEGWEDNGIYAGGN